MPPKRYFKRRPANTYYAIHIGRSPGVVSTWPECQTRIQSFKGARYKKFHTREDAEYYVKHGVGPAKTTAPNSGATSIMDFMAGNQEKIIHVYTDGSCINNGRPNARAGYGVWFGHNDCRNLSHPLRGRPTNNRAELTAILVALKRLQPELDAGERIVIHTDSEYSMKCFGEYGRRCQSQNWKGSDGKEIANRDLVEKGVPLFRQYPKVTLRYIKAHTGDSDQHSHGNAMADQLALSGSRLAIG